MAFYNEEGQLYLEIDASFFSLGARLLQVRDGWQFPRNEDPDNVALQSIAFMTKSLTSAEMHYSSIEREVLGILHGPETFHPLLLCPQRQHDNRQQTTCRNFHEKYSQPQMVYKDYYYTFTNAT